MMDSLFDFYDVPVTLGDIERKTKEMQFKMASEHKTGVLLRWALR